MQVLPLLELVRCQWREVAPSGRPSQPDFRMHRVRVCKPVFHLYEVAPLVRAQLSVVRSRSGCPPPCSRSPAAWAAIHIRSRRWSKPAQCAPSTPHCASNPSAAKSPRIVPSPRVVRAGLFSTNANRGCTSPRIRLYSLHNPLRSPSSPSPVPAVLMSWHGKPPETTSTTPRHGCPSKVRTSSQTGNGDRWPSFWRCMSRRAQKALISTAQTHRQPSKCPPRMPPPAPAKSASSFKPPPAPVGRRAAMRQWRSARR